MTPSPSDSRLLPRAAFRTTEWTMVLAAGRRGSAEGDAALERLCQQYWFPVYAVKPKKFSRPPEQDHSRRGLARKSSFRIFGAASVRDTLLTVGGGESKVKV
jgi:hypothetical protein